MTRQEAFAAIREAARLLDSVYVEQASLVIRGKPVSRQDVPLLHHELLALMPAKYALHVLLYRESEFHRNIHDDDVRQTGRVFGELGT